MTLDGLDGLDGHLAGPADLIKCLSGLVGCLVGLAGHLANRLACLAGLDGLAILQVFPEFSC